jgi:uncharacterized phage protein (TIGR02220 family)
MLLVKQMMKGMIKEIIAFLNTTCGTDYKAEALKSVFLLRNLIEKGHTLDDFKFVITNKNRQWKGTKFEPYLRPETLFGGNFQIYLDERNRKSGIQQIADSVKQAKRTNWRLDKR